MQGEQTELMQQHVCGCVAVLVLMVATEHDQAM